MDHHDPRRYTHGHQQRRLLGPQKSRWKASPTLRSRRPPRRPIPFHPEKRLPNEAFRRNRLFRQGSEDARSQMRAPFAGPPDQAKQGRKGDGRTAQLPDQSPRKPPAQTAREGLAGRRIRLAATAGKSPSKSILIAAAHRCRADGR